MTTTLSAYLNFRDNAREAMEFYKSVFGGELRVQTFGEFQASDDPAEGGKVMHAQLESPSGLVMMAADTPNRMEYKPAAGFSLSLSGEDESELRGYFDKLADGGSVDMPLAKAAWGDTFGMLTDRFGIHWLVNVNSGQQG